MLQKPDEININEKNDNGDDCDKININKKNGNYDNCDNDKDDCHEGSIDSTSDIDDNDTFWTLENVEQEYNDFLGGNDKVKSTR